MSGDPRRGHPGSDDRSSGTPRDRVAEAMAAVRREDFLRPADRWHAGYDAPIPIGHGQTSSQPSTVAAMLTLLDVRRGQHVLDVGCGSGWTTALLARLTGETGSVLGLERVPDLVAFGAANLARTGMPWARIEAAAPDRLGSPADGPYDRILVSAQPDRLPEALVDQLAEGGILVIPVAGRMLRVRRTGAARAVTEHGRYLFVPLVEGG